MRRRSRRISVLKCTVFPICMIVNEKTSPRRPSSDTGRRTPAHIQETLPEGPCSCWPGAAATHTQCYREQFPYCF